MIFPVITLVPTIFLSATSPVMTGQTKTGRRLVVPFELGDKDKFEKQVGEIQVIAYSLFENSILYTISTQCIVQRCLCFMVS